MAESAPQLGRGGAAAVSSRERTPALTFEIADAKSRIVLDEHAISCYELSNRPKSFLTPLFMMD